MAAAAALQMAAKKRSKAREEAARNKLGGDADNFPAAFGVDSAIAARTVGMELEAWRALQLSRRGAAAMVLAEQKLNERVMDMSVGCCSESCKCHSFFTHSQRVVTDHSLFGTFITGVIFVAAAQVGIQTYDIQSESLILTLLAMDEVIMGIFMCEVVMKTLAAGKRPWEYLFTALSVRPFIKVDWWNTFDFLIVAAALMPVSGNSFVAVLRLLRLLRVLKLVKALPRLRIVVMAVLNSIPAVFYNSVLLFLLMYLFGVFGVIFFGVNDPIHYGTIHAAIFTLYRSATCEDWTDVMYINRDGCDKYGYGSADMAKLCVEPTAYPFLSYAFHILFIMIASWMLLSLLIGVISEAMSTAQDDVADGGTFDGEAELNPDADPEVDYDLTRLRLRTLAAALAEEGSKTEVLVDQEDGVVVEEWTHSDGTAWNVCRLNLKVYSEGGEHVGRWGQDRFAKQPIPPAEDWENGDDAPLIVAVEEWVKASGGATWNVCRETLKVYDDVGVNVGTWGQGEFAGESVPAMDWSLYE